MSTVTLTGDLVLTDGTYRVTGNIGNYIALQNQATGERSSAHIADLFPRITEPPNWTPSCTPQDLAVLPADERREVEEWAAHIEEMISGARPGHDTPRPKYDPACTTLNERADAKVAELAARNWSTSRATLFRKKRRYEQGGAAALIDARKNRREGPLDKANEHVLDAIATVLAAQTATSTKTDRYLHRLVEAELQRRFAGSDQPAPAMPSQATMYRHVAALRPGKYATGKATTRRSLANRPDRTYKSRRTILPGEEVQVDSTPMDILVRVEGRDAPVRPILTVLIDVATRSIIASTIRIDAAKGYDHALLLAQALVPYQNRPDRSLHRALVAARRPEFALLGETERAQLERARPFIFPRRIMTDNGRDYLSSVFTSACAKYGIDITTSAVRTPTDKSIVERNFRSIATLFLQGLPGYVGNHVVNRGDRVEDDDLLSLSTLSELFDDWVANVWQNRPHSGLVDLHEPTITYSPNQAFAAAQSYSGSMALPLNETDFIELLPSEFRVIGTVGVELNSRQYDSPDLHPYRGTPSRIPKRGNKWEVKYNPYDAMHVWVRSPDGQWIECAWRRAAVIGTPHFGDITRELRTAARTEARNDAAQQHARHNGVEMPAGTTVEPAAVAATIVADYSDDFTHFEPFTYDED